jgi:hypothetical protein
MKGGKLFLNILISRTQRFASLSYINHKGFFLRVFKFPLISVRKKSIKSECFFFFVKMFLLILLALPLMTLGLGTCVTPASIPMSAIVSALENPIPSTEFTLSVSDKELLVDMISSKPIVWDLPEQDENAVKNKMAKALSSMEVCRTYRNEMLGFRPRRVCRFTGEV